MRRKGKYKKRIPVPDSLYGRVDMARFIHYLMKAGKKSVAEKVFYGALQRITEETKDDSIETFERALANATPKLEVVSRRMGGANYQVPTEVRPERAFFLAAHWIIAAARAKKGKPMKEKLAEELTFAAKHEGAAIKKKLEMHRVAEANRAFASLAR